MAVQTAMAEKAHLEALNLDLSSEADTLALGRALAEVCGPGDVVLLLGELGAGKTVLAKGLGRGLGVDEDYAIVSPTFTLLNVYPGRSAFYHADLYRLSQGQAAELEVLDEAAEGVLAVEWADRAGDLWPANSLRVEIFILPDERRRAKVSGPRDKLEQLKLIQERDRGF